jgi:hypothetical protein
MARLKVKQISDFESAVQNLIDIDVDQNAASISSALSAGVSAGVLAGEVSTELSDEVASIDLILAGKAGNGDVTAVSVALSTEISSTNSDVVRIDNLLASVATDAELSNEVLSIDARISTEENTRSVDVKAVSDAVSAILAGSDADLDQFAEVISYVDSLDTADGGALTAAIASIEGVVSRNSSLDVVLSDALSAEIEATDDDVSSIDLVLGTMGTSETITAISTALSTEISSTNSDFVSSDLRFEDVESDIDSLETSVDARVSVIEDGVEANANNHLHWHEMGTMVSRTEFTIPNAVDNRPTKDLLVFINGHNIHPLLGESGDGYSTADGRTFSLVNIGYDLEANDHIYVTGIRA